MNDDGVPSDFKPPHVQKLIERSTKHGLMWHPLYNVWKNMRSRCNSDEASSFIYYGGRGISICYEWDDFGAFHDWALSAGWTPGLEIDRIDVNGNYQPENCRWVTREINCQNRRSTKLTPDQVREIFDSSDRQRSIAAAYGISRSMVQQIKARQTWKNVTTTL